MNPSEKNINQVLAQIESAERPVDHPRTLAREAIVRRRERSSPQLTQAQIDSSDDEDARRRRFVASAVKWSKRSLWAKLFRWR